MMLLYLVIACVELHWALIFSVTKSVHVQ